MGKDLLIITKEASFEEIQKECQFIPSNLPKDKSLRMLKIGDFSGMPDGGVHVKSTKEIGKIKVEQLPAKTGIYYLRFLEWMIMLVRQLRQRVEDGRAWLSTFQKRQKKRLGYWKMYKKHGTTFGLSHERTLATQTG